MSGITVFGPDRRRRGLNAGDLERAKAISDDLIERAKAAMERVAVIDEDDGEERTLAAGD